MIWVTEFRSPIGVLKLATREEQLCLLTPVDRWTRARAHLARRSPDDAWRHADDPGGVVSSLRRYFDGEVWVLDDIDVELSGSPFQRRAWQAMRAIPPGTTDSYRSLAANLGSPRGIRAVGSAAGNNPIGLVVPCHRVVRSDGGLGGYGWGLQPKRWLLEHEKTSVKSNATAGQP